MALVGVVRFGSLGAKGVLRGRFNLLLGFVYLKLRDMRSFFGLGMERR